MPVCVQTGRAMGHLGAGICGELTLKHFNAVTGSSTWNGWWAYLACRITFEIRAPSDSPFTVHGDKPP